jgi:hypothetical protein
MRDTVHLSCVLSAGSVHFDGITMPDITVNREQRKTHKEQFQ